MVIGSHVMSDGQTGRGFTSLVCVSRVVPLVPPCLSGSAGHGRAGVSFTGTLGPRPPTPTHVLCLRTPPGIPISPASGFSRAAMTTGTTQGPPCECKCEQSSVHHHHHRSGELLSHSTPGSPRWSGWSGAGGRPSRRGWRRVTARAHRKRGRRGRELRAGFVLCVVPWRRGERDSRRRRRGQRSPDESTQARNERFLPFCLQHLLSVWANMTSAEGR